MALNASLSRSRKSNNRELREDPMVGDLVKGREPRKVLIVGQNAARGTFILESLASDTSNAQIVLADELEASLLKLGFIPEIVILDSSNLKTPAISSVALMRRKFEHCTIVALDGPSDNDFALKLTAAGVDEYLALNSYDSQILGTTISYSLERKVDTKKINESPKNIDPWELRNNLKPGASPPLPFYFQDSDKATSLQNALDSDEFVLHYQPIVDLTSGNVRGVEALIRWQHPSEELVKPDVFIPYAETSGDIIPIGAWVIKTACDQAVTWTKQGLDLEMSINLSTRQISQPDLIDTLSNIIKLTGIDPTRLVFEVTESAIMEDAEQAVAVLSQIASFGIALAIDDFGTGYSSLVYLKRYPIRVLKIDKSFIDGLGISTEDDAIVASVIELAKAVGGSCVAEGVETVSQQNLLYELGCEYAQGWLFGAAVPAEDLPSLIVECERDLHHPRPRVAPVHASRILAADERDLAANERDAAAAERDNLANERDVVANERDSLANERDAIANVRDNAPSSKRENQDQSPFGRN